MEKLFKKRKGLVLQLLIIAFMMSSSIFCYAQGWTDISGDWYYLDKNGEAYANSFVEKDGEVLYLGETGKITRNRFFEHNDNYYYAKENGTLAKNEFVDVKYNEASEIGMQEARYYFNENCKSVRRTGDIFKKLIDGNYYAFDADGVLLIGWLDKDGNILEQGDILKDGVYCTDENGVLMKNRWYNFVHDIGIFANDNIDNILNAVEFDNMESMWMYFDDNCKKLQASNLEKEKKKKINGIEYAFDENGIMLIYFNKVGGVDSTTQASNPTSKSRAIMYSAEDGQLATNRWFWLYPSKELDEKEYYDQEMHWWHTDSKGKLYTNVIKEIDGKKYVFDGIGRLKAGFVLADGNKYVANFMPEDLTREDFLYNYAQGSRLYGKELSDIRYFGDDDKLDGSMKKGEVDIELSDGVSTFCFRSDGRAYAGRATSSVPQKIKKIYYINGLKLKSINDKKYGFIRVNDAEEVQGQYKLVDKNGKVMKSKKIYNDDDGNYILVHGDMIVGYKLESELPGPNVSIKWRKEQGDQPAGFYYYDKDTDVSKDHYHYGLCIDPLVTPNITDDDLSKLDKDMRLNFK